MLGQINIVTKGGKLPEMIKKKEKSGIRNINIVTMGGKLHLQENTLYDL